MTVVNRNRYATQKMFFPIGPSTFSAIEIKLVSLGIHRLTSTKASPVQSIKSQQMMYVIKEGIKPAGPVATGKANIPTPIVVPATKRVPPTTCPRECIIRISEEYSQELSFWIVEF